MKTLFLAVTAHLQDLGKLKYIDMDKGQLEAAGRPAVAFPCALVKVGFPAFDNLGGDLKTATGTVRIRIAFDNAAQRTSEDVAQLARDASLMYIDTASEIFDSLRSFETNEYSAFEATEFVQEDRRDGLVVMRISFRTYRID